MKHAFFAAFILLALAMPVIGAPAAPPEPRADSWLWRFLGYKPDPGIGIAARNRDYTPQPNQPAKSQPVYDGLGAGTDHGEYMSAPPPQKDQR